MTQTRLIYALLMRIFKNTVGVVLFFGGRISEIFLVISEKRRVVGKAAALVYLRGLIPHLNKALRGKKTFVIYVFFRASVQLVFENTVKIAFGNEDSVGNLGYTSERKEIVVYVFQRGG